MLNTEYILELKINVKQLLLEISNKIVSKLEGVAFSNRLPTYFAENYNFTTTYFINQANL